MRNLRGRLVRLERVFGDSGVSRSIVSAVRLSDEEEADRSGEFLWAGFAIDKQYRQPCGRSSSLSATRRAWDEAAEAAWAGGHRDYHVGLRPFAMAVCLESKPYLLKHRQTHDVWIHTGEPVRADALTAEEFERLPLDERIAVLREHRPGYWSKHGPPSEGRTRSGRRER
jgi:hypothetical protein